MLDISQVPDGKDLVLTETLATKAANVVSIQIGDLEYAPNFGVDFRYFLTSNLEFQNQSFKAYIIQTLSQNQVNVSNAVEVVEALYERIIFSVGDSKVKRGLL